MFPRRDRLPRAQFAAALSSGRRLSSEHFVVVLPKVAKGYAVILPKKVVRLSTERHLLKRRVLEALKEVPFQVPAALIVFPRRSASSVHYQDIVTELTTLLSPIRT